MTGIYQHKWVSGIGAEVHETWVMGLADITDDELAAGLRGCLLRAEKMERAGDEDWPPTLGQFRLLCRPTPYQFHTKQLALPTPKLTDEEKAARRQEMKKLQAQCKEDGEAMDRQRIERLWELRRTSRLTLGQMLEPDREPGEDDDKPTKGE